MDISNRNLGLVWVDVTKHAASMCDYGIKSVWLLCYPDEETSVTLVGSEMVVYHYEKGALASRPISEGGEDNPALGQWYDTVEDAKRVAERDWALRAIEHDQAPLVIQLTDLLANATDALMELQDAALLLAGAKPRTEVQE